MQVIIYTQKIIADEGNKGRKISIFSWLVNLDCIFFCHFFSNINITKMFSEESSSKIYYWLHCTVLDANKELEAKLETDRVPVQEISNRQTDEAHTDTKMHQKVFTTTIILVHKAKWCTADLEKSIRQLKTTWLNTSRTQDLETLSQPLFFSRPPQYQYYSSHTPLAREDEGKEVSLVQSSYLKFLWKCWHSRDRLGFGVSSGSLVLLSGVCVT